LLASTIERRGLQPFPDSSLPCSKLAPLIGILVSCVYRMFYEYFLFFLLFMQLTSNYYKLAYSILPFYLLGVIRNTNVHFKWTVSPFFIKPLFLTTRNTPIRFFKIVLFRIFVELFVFIIDSAVYSSPGSQAEFLRLGLFSNMNLKSLGDK
jgi:hypothetical protein